MALPEIDYKTLTDFEIGQLYDQVNEERNRRDILRNAQQRIEALTKTIYEARGGDGREFIQPTGAVDAYPKDAVIKLNGKTYKSLIDANVWSPMTYPRGWVELVTVTPPDDTSGAPLPPTPTVTAWAPGQAVKPGDVRSYNGSNYVCIQGHTTQAGWEPDMVAALWTKSW